MATLKEKAQQILDEKQAKILPENIKKDIQIFDIVGTVDEGVDTSDADALAEDIVENKTAYVNGVKIVGNIRKYDTENKFLLSSMVVGGFSEDGAYIYGTPDQIEHGCPAYIPDYGSVTVRFQKTGLRSYLGITPEILKKDTTVLGTTGILEGVKGQEKTVTPTNKQQIIVPDEGYNALTSVTVEASESTSVDSKYSPHQFDELEEISIGNTFMIDETRFNETPNIGDKYYFVNYSTSEMNLNLCVCKVLSTEDNIQYKCEVLDVVPVVDGFSIPKDFVEVIEGDVGTPSISTEEDSVFMKFIENVPAISLMPNSTISVSVKNETLAEGIGLTPDKIKLGENILGIDGEYEGKPSTKYEEVELTSLTTGDKIIGFKKTGSLPTGAVIGESLLDSDMNGLISSSSVGDESTIITLNCNGSFGGTNYGCLVNLFSTPNGENNWQDLTTQELFILNQPLTIDSMTSVTNLAVCLKAIKVVE